MGGTACLAALLAAAIEPVRGAGTVGDLIRLVIESEAAPPAWAEMALKRLGLRVMTDHAGGRVLALASHHAAITALLDGTAWAAAPMPGSSFRRPLRPGHEWMKALRQIGGAKLSRSRHRFPPLPEPARALFLPLPVVAAHLTIKPENP